jgi:hypothetical protein
MDRRKSSVHRSPASGQAQPQAPVDKSGGKAGFERRRRKLSEQQSSPAGVRIAPIPSLRKAKALVQPNQASTKKAHFRPWAVLWHLQRLQERHGGELGNLRNYARHCAKRLRSLRVSVAYTCSMSRRSSQYAQARIDSGILREHAGGDRRFLEIGILEAERAWAQAMDAKDQLLAMVSRLGSVSDGNWSVWMELPSLTDLKQRRAHRLRRYFLRRLRRAAELAERLLWAALTARDCLPAWTMIELLAYACWLWVVFSLEQGQASSETRSLLQLTHQLYSALSDAIPLEASNASTQVRHIHQIYRQRVHELERATQACAREAVRPQVEERKRLITFWKRIDLALVQKLLDELDAIKIRCHSLPEVVVGERSANEALPETGLSQNVCWCGHSIPVPNVPVESLVSRARSSRSKSSLAFAASSSRTLLELLTQAERYAKIRMAKATRLFDAALRYLGALLAERPTDDDLRLFLSFWRYRKALARLRNCVERGKDDQAATWVQEIGDLFGISEPLHETAQTVGRFLRLRQVIRSAQQHWERFLATERDTQQGEATALQELALTYAFSVEALQLHSSMPSSLSMTPDDDSSECSELIKACGMDEDALKSFDKQARGLKVRACAYFALDEVLVAERFHRANISNETSSSSKRYLLEHLSEYITPDEIVRLPPALRPMTCKPFVLDLASQEVSYPTLPERRDTRRGLLHRWFGR